RARHYPLSLPDALPIYNVSRATLRNIPRGPTLGIAGAPDALPLADELVELPWQLCSVPPTTDSPAPETTLVVGEEIPGGSSPGEDRKSTRLNSSHVKIS